MKEMAVESGSRVVLQYDVSLEQRNKRFKLTNDGGEDGDKDTEEEMDSSNSDGYDEGQIIAATAIIRKCLHLFWLHSILYSKSTMKGSPLWSPH
jgi:hypothetical protein